MWPDRRLLDLLDLEHPIVQAPMAGAMDWELAATVSAAGGLGSLPCAMLPPGHAREEVARIRAHTGRPFNMNFFAHREAAPDEAAHAAWRARLAPYYRELNVDAGAPVNVAARAPFDEDLCALVEEIRPAVASFHFGLPEPPLLRRVQQAGCIVFASATTVAEARWLAERGVDVIVAQGAEAGGHRGLFLTDQIATQPGTFALVPQIVDAVGVPVIAAGGVADARGIAAACALGAAGVQIGSAYLHCPEAKISNPHRLALTSAGDAGTVITNVLTGRPARGVLNRIIREMGPIAEGVPAFPGAAGALIPLRGAAEARESGDFSPMWAGQAAALGRPLPAGELTRQLAAGALNRMRTLGIAADGEVGR